MKGSVIDCRRATRPKTTSTQDPMMRATVKWLVWRKITNIAIQINLFYGSKNWSFLLFMILFLYHLIYISIWIFQKDSDKHKKPPTNRSVNKKSGRGSSRKLVGLSCKEDILEAMIIIQASAIWIGNEEVEQKKGQRSHCTGRRSVNFEGRRQQRTRNKEPIDREEDKQILAQIEPISTELQ